jgi:peptide chain release factor 1
MKPSMLAKLDQLANRLTELDELLMSEGATDNMDAYRKMTREHAELGPLVALYHDYQQALVISPRRRKCWRSRHEGIRPGRNRCGQSPSGRAGTGTAEMLLPKDANDERNIFLEIRAGTGGDESALFAGDLLRMYTRFAERNRWQVEVVSESPSDLGGYREVIVRLVGNGVYSG